MTLPGGPCPWGQAAVLDSIQEIDAEPRQEPDDKPAPGDLGQRKHQTHAEAHPEKGDPGGTLVDLLVAPISNSAVLVAYVLAAVLRSLVFRYSAAFFL